MTATALDVKARAAALRLLNKFGKSVTYRRRTPSTYNPATSSNSPTSADYTVKTYVSMPSKTDLERGILSTEMTCLIAAAALSFDPSPQDQLVIDGVVYTVRPVAPVWSGEQKALWFVGIKKG